MATTTSPHGPLPPLPPTWYEHARSSAAKCPDYPEGCGEYTRRPGGREAVLRHRDGCAVRRGEISREEAAAWLAAQAYDGPMGAYRLAEERQGLSNAQWLLVVDAYRQHLRDRFNRSPGNPQPAC